MRDITRSRNKFTYQKNYNIKMKKLNWVRKIIIFPIKLILLPVFGIMLFFCTNWENRLEIDYYKKTMCNLYNL